MLVPAQCKYCVTVLLGVPDACKFFRLKQAVGKLAGVDFLCSTTCKPIFFFIMFNWHGGHSLH